MSLSSVFKNADLITSLPTDDSETSPKEKGILDMLYPSNTSIANSNTVVNNQSKEKPAFRFKDIIVASFVFVLLNNKSIYFGIFGSQSFDKKTFPFESLLLEGST